MIGQRGILIEAMFTKYALTHVALAPEERLRMLEDLERMPFADVTSEAIAAIEPCGHDVARMVMEAMDLPPEKPWQKLSAGWKVLATEPVWSKLCELNPSLLKAMSLFRWGPIKEAA